MDAIVNISLGIFYGFWDSLKGMTMVFYIDGEIHKLNQRDLVERQRSGMRMHDSPSSIPSSASTMKIDATMTMDMSKRHNPDERRIESLRRKSEQSVEKVNKGEMKIAEQVFKCCILNGGFTWLSIIIFEQLLMPTLKFFLTICYGEHTEELHFVWSWLHSILSLLFSMMWVLPIFLLSKIVSSLWFTDIANEAYRVRKGRPQLISSISKLIADFLFSLMVQALFLVQSMLVNLIPIPYVGSSLYFMHLCLLYSLYCFEYKWFNMGWELHRRLSYIESNWPYFLGFGIPLTVLTNASKSVIVSGCIFSIFFPLFILSGNEAKPIVETTGTPIRLFAPVIFVSNLFFNRSPRNQKVSPGVAIKSTNLIAQQEKQLILQREVLRKQQVQHQEQQQKHHIDSRQYIDQVECESKHRQRNVEVSYTPFTGSSSRVYDRGLHPPLIPTPIQNVTGINVAKEGILHRNRL